MARELSDVDLDRLLQSTNVSVDMADPALESALDELGTSITQSAIVRKPRRRRLIAAGVLVAALAAGAPAAATWVSAHTGTFGDPGMTENDTTEWLRLDSPEIDVIIDQKAALYALPPGGDWSVMKKNLHSNDEPTVMQESGIEMTVALNAACQWEKAWLNADAAKDAIARQNATRVLGDVANWKVIRDHDGGGTVDAYIAVAKGAANGDRAAVLQSYLPNCADEYGQASK